MSMKPITSTLLLLTLLPCIACGQLATEELDGTATPVPDTSAIITAVERNLATIEEMPPDNIEDDTLPGNLAQQLRLFFSCASIEEINRFIDPEIGLTILYANGCYPEYSQLDSLDPNKNAYQYTLPFWISESLFQSIDFKNLKINHFQYTYTPVFQRETIFKEGVFIDQSEDKTVMSNAIKNLICF